MRRYKIQNSLSAEII